MNLIQVQKVSRKPLVVLPVAVGQRSRQTTVISVKNGQCYGDCSNTSGNFLNRDHQRSLGSIKIEINDTHKQRIHHYSIFLVVTGVTFWELYSVLRYFLYPNHLHFFIIHYSLGKLKI